eukprot:TRINITY_DN80254_c0_g1_i1.p1 TRINITY_DN80254_c0_g1~~TRINITY_DN80254_c0_g1_i1.p1  ORF type:complete len:183 (-),score=9.30 TRINITY_DN80254_c0_g1_i1:38-586(-)
MSSQLRLVFALGLNVILTGTLVGLLWLQTQELGLIPAFVLPTFFAAVIVLVRIVPNSCCSQSLRRVIAEGATEKKDADETNKTWVYVISKGPPAFTRSHYALLCATCVPYIGLLASLCVSLSYRVSDKLWMTSKFISPCGCVRRDPFDLNFQGLDVYEFEHHYYENLLVVLLLLLVLQHVIL